MASKWVSKYATYRTSLIYYNRHKNDIPIPVWLVLIRVSITLPLYGPFFYNRMGIMLSNPIQLRKRKAKLKLFPNIYHWFDHIYISSAYIKYQAGQYSLEFSSYLFSARYTNTSKLSQLLIDKGWAKSQNEWLQQG